MSRDRLQRRTLANAREFQQVFRSGKVESGSNLVIHIVRRRDGRKGRYGLVVSRKVGGAVERNRVRRRLRAAIAEAGGLPPGIDAVLVVKANRRPGVAEMSREIATVMQKWKNKAGNGMAG